MVFTLDKSPQMTYLDDNKLRSNVTCHAVSIPQRKVISMDEISKLKIVQHNKLIESSVKMEKNPLKFFEMAVAAIDTETALNGKNLVDNTVRFEKKVIYKLIGAKAEDTNKYDRLRKQVMKMMNSSAFEVIEDKGDNNIEIRTINAISEVNWGSNKSFVEVVFTPQIMPYLIDLKKNGLYTQYKLENLANMTSKYSIVLFKWLVLNYNQYAYYKNKSKRSEKQLYELQNPKISVDDLRMITGTKKEYAVFADFEKRILKKPIEEINKFTNLIVSYEKIKSGKFIKEIQFFISEKPKKFIAPDNEVLPPLSKDEQEELQARKLYEATNNKYTKILVEYGVLSAFDMIDTKKMIRVADELLPIYKDMEKSIGEDKIINHISYVYNKSFNSEKKIIDLIGYYIKSARSYLDKIR